LLADLLPNSGTRDDFIPNAIPYGSGRPPMFSGAVPP
jgi:hypothetical protein